MNQLNREETIKGFNYSGRLHLTELIFIEDNFGALALKDFSIGAIYSNRNATNSLRETFDYNLLNGEVLADVFDDFKHDNY